MKDASTHLAHKAEHVVDLESGAALGDIAAPSRPGGHGSRWSRAWRRAFDHAAEAIEKMRRGTELRRQWREK